MNVLVSKNNNWKQFSTSSFSQAIADFLALNNIMVRPTVRSFALTELMEPQGVLVRFWNLTSTVFHMWANISPQNSCNKVDNAPVSGLWVVKWTKFEFLIQTMKMIVHLLTPRPHRFYENWAQPRPQRAIANACSLSIADGKPAKSYLLPSTIYRGNMDCSSATWGMLSGTYMMVMMMLYGTRT